MTDKQQQLTFDKGITNVPSDALCSDNALEESIGMVYDNGEHRVIQKPKVLVNSRRDILFVHTYSNEKRYIYLESGGLWWIKDAFSAHQLLSSTSQTKVESVGKTIIVSDSNGMHYFLWNDDGYLNIGEFPEVDLDCHMFNRHNFHCYSEVSTDGIFVTDGGRLNVVEKEQYKDAVAGLYAKNLKAVAQKKGFCQPFFVRAALKLYDGSYTRVSQPILMAPHIRGNTYTWLANDKMHMRTFYKKLFICQKEDFSNWSDIVKDITIFVSDGIDMYDTDIDYFSEHSYITPETTTETTLDYIDGIYKDVVHSSLNKYRPLSTSTGFPEDLIDAPRRKTENDYKSDIESASVFYKLCDIGINSFTDFKDVGDFFEVHKLENITTQEQLPQDDFFSRSKLYPNMMYSYNSRLNIANVKRRLFEGFHNFMPLDDIYNGGLAEKEYTFCVTIKLNTGETKTVYHKPKDKNGLPLQMSQRQGGYFFYPDSRAIHVTIYDSQNDSNAHYVCDEELTEHPSLNGAYFFRGFDQMIDNGEITPEDTGNKSRPANNSDYNERLNNYIITSEVNNPFVFLAEGYNAIGNGNIIEMSSITQALSQGQFGQYPLLVFSTDGIWAMSVNNTGLYQTIRPMSREVALEDNPAITQTDGAIFFVSKKGLMVVDGGQVRCVSPQLSGKTEASEFLIANVGDLQTFLSGCMIAYDYRDSLLWITSPLFRYCYIYSIKNGTFGKYDFGTYNVGNQTFPVSIINIVNDYPDYLICTNVSVLSLLKRPNVNDDISLYDGTLISRPMKLENAFALKSLMHINHLYSFEEDSSVVLRIFGSNNLRSWVELSSLRGTPWLYYRFRYNFTNMKATDLFAGTIVETQERRADKPRTYLSELNSNVRYIITTSYDNDPEGMVIPKNQQTLTILFDVHFYKQIEEAQPQGVNCYWVIWAQLKNGTFSQLQYGYGNENTQKNVTLTADMDAIVVGMNINNAPTPASSQVTKHFKVTKIPDDATVYTYSVGSNIDTIVIPAGEASVEKQVMGYALRTANGDTESFACYIKMWRLTNSVYTKIAGNTVPSYGAGAYDVFERTDTAVVIAISDTQMSDTYGINTYLATKSIRVDSSSNPEPDPGPDPDPGPEPTPSDVHVNLRIVSNVNAWSTGEIKFYVDDHNGIFANLPNASPWSNVYPFPANYDNTFSNVECMGNRVDVSDFLNTALDGDVVVYAFDGETHNSSMVTATISGEDGLFVDGGTYTITITAYTPPEPTPSVDDVTTTVTITNNSGSSITFDGRVCFITYGTYDGYTGYFRIKGSCSGSDFTIANGASKTYTITFYKDSSQTPSVAIGMRFATQAERNQFQSNNGYYVSGSCYTCNDFATDGSVVFAQNGIYTMTIPVGTHEWTSNP